MIKSGEYDKKVIIRKLQIDEARDVVDFSGKTVEPSDISGKYNAFVTPTLVFLDHQGNERIKQMVGINTVEMFGAYLDIEIDKLTQELVAGKQTDNKTALID
jgi:thioredoxin-related protein